MPGKTSFAHWVRDHAISADTLDPQAPLDDLEPLRAVIGDACVVAIGESAHYVREFYLLRHRLLRFLAERCGFTVYALEAPFSAGHAVDAWVQGGPGTVAEVAAAGVAIDIGRCSEMHDHLTWMRAHNHTAAVPLRFTGTDVPGCGGAPLPALAAVADYLRWADPDALPLLEQAAGLARRYHDTTTFNVLHRYTTLEPAVQDALIATLSRLLSRMETDGRLSAQPAPHAGARHRAPAPAQRLAPRSPPPRAGRGMAVGSASRDAFIAESVLRLLEDGTRDTRIVVASHNIHIQRTPESHDGPLGIFLQGYHLAQALGHDYRAIAATSNHGRTARIQPDREHPRTSLSSTARCRQSPTAASRPRLPPRCP